MLCHSKKKQRRSVGVRSIGGMIVTGENWSTGTETCPVATNNMGGPGSEPGPSTTNRLSQRDCDCRGRDAVLAGYRRFREICCVYVNFKGIRTRQVLYSEQLGCWTSYMLCVFRKLERLCRPDRVSNARVRIGRRLGCGERAVVIQWFGRYITPTTPHNFHL